MPILKLIAIFFYFLRAMIFENQREWDWKSPHFDPRKVLLLILLVQSFALNVVVIRNNIHLHKQRTALMKILKTNNVEVPAVFEKKKEKTTE